MDPNEVVGRPVEREVWLSPDWSEYKPVTAKQPNGYTRVSIRTTTYKDGRVVTQVLDANHQPITWQTIPEESDPDVKKAWDAAQKDQTPPGGLTTQRRQAADGTTHIYGWNPQTRQYDVDQGTVQAPATVGRVEGTPTGRTNPDGTPEYDNTKPIWVERDASGQQVGPAKPLTAEQRAQWEKDTGRAQGTTARQEVPGHPGVYHVVSKDANGNTDDHYEDANGNRVAAPTDVKPQPQLAADGSWGYWDTSKTPPTWVPLQGPSGKKYTDVKFDEQRGQWWGLTPQGTWEPMTGGPGARTGPQKPGPAMPTFIVGMASDALRQFGDQLNAAVAAGDMTPAERDKRYAEAERAAQIAVNDAVTVQRQQESNLNARVNLATTRYTQQMDGLNNALSFVTKLNATLPEGSDLGGKAFAALLGMQAIAAKRSGITDIQIPGAPDMRSPQGQQIANATANTFGTASAQLSRLTNPADPAAVHADQQAVSAALQAPSQPPAPAPAAPAAPGPSGRLSPGYGDNLEYPFTARPVPAPPMAAPSSVATPTLPSSLPPADEFGRTPAMGGATPTPPADLETGTTPPYNDDPSKGPVGTTLPGDDFAIMKTLPSPAPVFAPPPPAVGDHPMLLMDRAQTTPPWRLDPSEIERMRAAGIPDATIFAVPGVAA